MMLLVSCRHLHVDGLNKVLVSFSASYGFFEAVCHGVAKSLPLAHVRMVWHWHGRLGGSSALLLNVLIAHSPFHASL